MIADNGEVTAGMFVHALGSFFMMGFGSAFIGIASGVASALLTKHVALHTVPSLEYTLVCVFAYLPYVLAEALSLSGIMAILFCGITMAHYTHFNLSPITQLTAQNTFRMAAFLAGIVDVAKRTICMCVHCQMPNTTLFGLCKPKNQQKRSYSPISV